MNNHVFIDSQKDWEFFSEGVKRKIIGYNKNLMMVRIKFDKGARVPAHHHPHVQCSIVESGKFTVIIGETEHVLGKGDGFFIPSEVIHEVHAREEGIIIDTFHPYREDFIKKT